MKLYSAFIFDVRLDLPSGVLIAKGRKNHVLRTTHDFMTEITDTQWQEIQAKHNDLISSGMLWAERTLQSANDHAIDADAEYDEGDMRPKTAEELDKELSNETKSKNRRK